MIRSCPACGGPGEKKFQSNVVEAKFSTTTCASRKSPIFDIKHLQMFSRDGLEALVRCAGFDVIHSKAIMNRYPLGYWLRLIPLPRRLKSLVERFRGSLILSIPISLLVGNRIVVAKKVT